MRNDSYHRGVWKKGEETITGIWVWSSFLQRFIITLDEKDEVTGQVRHFEVSGDDPDFNRWKLEKKLRETVDLHDYDEIDDDADDHIIQAWRNKRL